MAFSVVKKEATTDARQAVTIEVEDESAADITESETN